MSGCPDIDASMSGPEDVSMDENVLVSLPGAINCPTGNDPAPSGTLSQSPQHERPRPTRTANRPLRYQDSNFETQFQPKTRRRNCRKIKRNSQAGNNVSNVAIYQNSGRGDRQGNRPHIFMMTSRNPRINRRQEVKLHRLPQTKK